MYQVTAAQQAALSEKVCDCKCKEKSQQDLDDVKRLLNSARKASIQKVLARVPSSRALLPLRYGIMVELIYLYTVHTQIKSLMLDLEEHKSLLAEARRERSAATAQLIDLQNENSLIRSELKAASAAPPRELDEKSEEVALHPVISEKAIKYCGEYSGLQFCSRSCLSSTVLALTKYHTKIGIWFVLLSQPGVCAVEWSLSES